MSILYHWTVDFLSPEPLSRLTQPAERTLRVELIDLLDAARGIVDVRMPSGW
jgi:hypothetical protein